MKIITKFIRLILLPLPEEFKPLNWHCAAKLILSTPLPASKEDILRVHTDEHVKSVEREGVYEIAALAAGGAIKAAQIGLTEPCFAVIRPPGHHASADSAWGFCYFNNMAIALEKLKA